MAADFNFLLVIHSVQLLSSTAVNAGFILMVISNVMLLIDKHSVGYSFISYWPYSVYNY